MHSPTIKNDINIGMQKLYIAKTGIMKEIKFQNIIKGKRSASISKY
jgi:hypothetical protein